MSDIQQEVTEIKARLDKLEAQVKFLFKHLGITSLETPSWKASPEVVGFIRKKDKIAAIKAFMQETGASLKDAKEFVDSLMLEGKSKNIDGEM